MGRMAKCQSFPKILAIQTQWAQEATNDYVKQMNKLMEVNSRLMGGLLGSLGHFGGQSAEQSNSSPAKVSSKAAT